MAKREMTEAEKRYVRERADMARKQLEAEGPEGADRNSSADAARAILATLRSARR